VQRTALIVGLAFVLAGCGASGTRSAKSLRRCVGARLPAGSVDRVAATTVDGVTTIIYYHHGSETTASVFASEDDAKQAELAEARLGDAHDRRVGNVLYSGGGAAEEAVAACLG
jgi:hypothetical protein